MAIIDAIQYRKLLDGIGVNGNMEKVSTACMVHTSKSSWVPVSPHTQFYRVVARFVTTARPQAQAPSGSVSSPPRILTVAHKVVLETVVGKFFKVSNLENRGRGGCETMSY